MADDVCWTSAPPHLGFQRHRWRARALCALGRSDEAAAERATLEVQVAALLTARSHDDAEPPVLRANLALAKLDLALHRGDDTAPHLTTLDQLPQESRWLQLLHEHRPRHIPEPQWLADAFPY